jgi:sulfate transport system substrate-binding protein
MISKIERRVVAAGLAAFLTIHTACAASMLNVSYEPTRAFYLAYDKAFAEYWRQTTGKSVTIHQSHGGSSMQSRAILDGIGADVATLALGYDIDILSDQGLLPRNWQSRLPNDSAPYTSTIVFLVRKGNPKHIRDWDDLIRPGIRIVTPNPKTSGGARWNYLAAWGYALRHHQGSESAARNFVKALYGNAPVLDTGSRTATMTFTRRGLGDVLIAWENEALLATHQAGGDTLQIVRPSESIMAEPSVAVIDANAAHHGNLPLARAYLSYLYSPTGQTLAAEHFYRPTDSRIALRYRARFPEIRLFTLADIGIDWRGAQKKHFADGGVFDQIYLGNQGKIHG